MNKNPSPKSEFLKDSVKVKNHSLLVDNPVLQDSIAIALSEMQRRAAQNTPPENFNACAASHLRLLGAQDFLDILLNLAESTPASTRTDTANLASNVPTRKN